MILLSFNTKADNYLNQQICNDFALFAKEAMKARQQNIPQYKLYKNSYKDIYVANVTNKIINLSYQTPIESNQKSRQLQIANFSDKVLLGCIKKINRK